MPRCLMLLVALAVATLSASAVAGDWPQFRGPTGQGISAGERLPVAWDQSRNIAWRAPVSGLGWSSPVVAENQVWLTTAIEEPPSLRALAFDATTGRLLHDIEVFQPADLGRVNAKNSHASPTPLLDGDRVFVHFGSQGTACLTSAGEVAWRTKLDYDQHHGPGASPVVYQDLLIVNCDGVDRQYIVALNQRTGRVVWKSERQGKMGYSTPLLVQTAAGCQLICNCGNGLYSYDPATGKERWKLDFEGHSVIPMPVGDDKVLYACTGYWTPTLLCIEPHATELPTIKWRHRRGVPYTPSPLLVGQRLLLLSDRGILTCLDRTTGKEIFTRRVPGNYSASPLLAGSYIYLTSEEGTTTVLDTADDEWPVVARDELPERTLASLAASNGAIYLRTDKALYCIHASGGPTAPLAQGRHRTHANVNFEAPVKSRYSPLREK